MSVLLDVKTGDPESAAARFQLAGYAIAYRAGQGQVIDFEPAGHIYRHAGSGRILPSVTEILKSVGVSVNFDDIRSMGRDRAHAVDLKRDLGIALHADAHAYDDNDLDLSTVHEEVKPYLDAYVSFRQAYASLRPATRERIVYEPAYQYVGTLDGIFMVDGETEIDITERWSVQLTPKNRIPYRVTPYNEHPWIDDEKFKAFVTTYYEQSDRRRAA